MDITMTQFQIASLQQTIDILSKTNETLNQSWTPIMVILSALSAFFTLITIMAAIVFAYGFLIVKKIQTERQQSAKALRQLARERANLIAKLEQDSNEFLKKLSEKTEPLTDLKKELEDIKTESERAIERLNEKTLVTVSEISSTMSAPVFSDLLLGHTNSRKDAQVCSKCGVVFYETGPQIRASSIEFYSNNPFSLGGSRLCKHCRSVPITG